METSTAAVFVESLQPLELITHRYALADVNDAFGAHESYEAMVPVLLPNG